MAVKLPYYFERYLLSIQPSVASRARAIQLHTTLTSRLPDHADFRAIYAGSFLYGSYKRNTALNPIKDVDVCVLLDIDHRRHAPEKTVGYLRAVLEEIGYEDKTAYQQRSVRIDMSKTTLDVVPVVAINGNDQPLLIPDRALQQWISTHPKGHLDAASRLNAECGGRYIPLVKTAKAWHSYQRRDVIRPKPKGFTVEALVAQYQDPSAPSYAEAFAAFLENYWRACGADLQAGQFPDVPDPGIPGEIIKVRFTPDEAKAFGVVVYNSLEAATAALAMDGAVAPCAAAWRDVFGPKFPVGATEIVKSFAEGIIDTAEGEPFDNVMFSDPLPAPTLAPLTITVGVAATEGGRVYGTYPDDGEPLQKGLGLHFEIVGLPVVAPFSVTWTVTNHGEEARRAKDTDHVSRGASTTHWETTKYRGSQWMTCQVEKNGIPVARARYIVNIG